MHAAKTPDYLMTNKQYGAEGLQLSFVLKLEKNIEKWPNIDDVGK